MMLAFIATLAAAPPESTAAAAPNVRVVAFADADPNVNCPVEDARFGRCVERVEFADPSLLWSKPPSEARMAAASAAARGVSVAWARMWEDIAVRWGGEGDVLAELVAAGITELPSAARTWEVRSVPPHSWSMPNPDLWLQADRWSSQVPSGQTEGAADLFRRVRGLVPGAEPGIPDTVLLAGRFAQRLGYAGRLHDYDLMDAAPTTSGPFFEQIYPYGLAQADERLRILRHFGPGSNERAPAFEVAVRHAAREFEVMSATVLGQVARYALEDFTDNQMRVFAAVTLMRHPPDPGGARGGGDRDLVAASIFQTDSDLDVQARSEIAAAFATSSSVRLRYVHLPEPVVDAWLGGRIEPKDERELRAVESALYGVLADPIARPPLPDTTPAAIDAWLKAALPAGVDRSAVRSDMKQRALATLVDLAPNREALELQLLVAHVEHAIETAMDQSGALATPADVYDRAAKDWRGVLALHGQRTTRIEQGLGAVDPTAICTTRDGREALVEPSVGALNVDLFVDAPDVAQGQAPTLEHVLWGRAAELPFLAIDAARAADPERLVGLPGGRALYRVRWRVWSGWHVFWATQGVGDGRRLVARTGAVCEDMVLAPPDLVPTLARAALLEGEYRPTIPVRPRDARTLPPPPATPTATPDSDALVAAGQGGAKSATDTAKAAEAELNALEGEGLTVDKAASAAEALGGLFKRETNAIVEPVSPYVADVRRAMRQPLRRIAAAGNGLMVVVFDQTREPGPGPWADVPPRTPYATAWTPVPGGHGVRTSAWALFFPQSPKSGPEVIVSPAYRPTEQVATTAWMPRWRTNGTTSVSLVGGLSAFPYRTSSWTCAYLRSDLDVVAPCDPDAGATISDGFGIDVAVPVAIGIAEAPRLAFEVGPEFRVDVVRGGAEYRVGGVGTPMEYAWTFRPQGGVLVGLKFLPRPEGLWTRGAWPWGAERPDGTSRLGRTQGGVRLGILAGPSADGLETSVLAEGWWARSVRWPRSRTATLTPYHPGMTIGPFARAMFGFVPFPDRARHQQLDHSWTFSAGVRGALRIAAPPPSLPKPQ